MHGLVDAHAVLGEEVLDRADVVQDADLEAGLLPHLTKRCLLGRLTVRGCALGQRPRSAVPLALAHAQADLCSAVHLANDHPAARGRALAASATRTGSCALTFQPRHGAALRGRGRRVPLWVGWDQMTASARRRSVTATDRRVVPRLRVERLRAALRNVSSVAALVVLDPAGDSRGTPRRNPRCDSRLPIAG